MATEQICGAVRGVGGAYGIYRVLQKMEELLMGNIKARNFLQHSHVPEGFGKPFYTIQNINKLLCIPY
jgi:hypothetical protein